MQITKAQIEGLLQEAESTTLDFKSEQYPFAGATDIQKSELVKDILALANAFARTDAFILIGVKEMQGARAEVVGVKEQLDDANVQQLVHGCTKQHLVFSYKAMELEGKPIGVIHIPRQHRPFYPTKDFGKLKKHDVYFRRGSSTAVATPEEVAEMGRDKVPSASSEPVLEVSLYDTEADRSLGTTVSLKHLVLDIPSTISDYHESPDPISAMSRHTNHGYYRDLATYTQITNAARRLSFAVTNNGDVTAQGVKLVIDVEAPDKKHHFLSDDDMPDVPVPSRSMLSIPNYMPRGLLSSSMSIRRLPKKWQIEYDVGKIQPKATELLADALFVCAQESGTLTLKLKFFADNLRHPMEAECHLHHEVEHRQVTLDEIEEMEAIRFATSPEYRKLVEESE